MALPVGSFSRSPDKTIARSRIIRLSELQKTPVTIAFSDTFVSSQRSRVILLLKYELHRFGIMLRQFLPQK